MAGLLPEVKLPPAEQNAVGAVTLRDYFAAAALPAFLTAYYAGHGEVSDESKIADSLARDAYRAADAMLRARDDDGIR